MKDRRGPATVTERMPAARRAAATGQEAGKARRESSEARRPPSDPQRRSPSRKGAKACALDRGALRRILLIVALVRRGRRRRRPRSTSGSRARPKPSSRGRSSPTATTSAPPPTPRRRATGSAATDSTTARTRSPGPTPTAAGADAMASDRRGLRRPLVREPFEDYFLKRWGPDAQNEGAGEYWGVVVNNVFTSVGGCQYQLDGGDEVLWVYDAFSDRPRLLLYPAGYSAAARAAPLTAGRRRTAFEVEVDSWGGYNEGDPPAAPTRSTTALRRRRGRAGGDGRAGVRAGRTGQPAGRHHWSGRQGEISFAQTGWHRIKATVVNSGGKETVVRSNRLDVCVTPDPSCATLPPEDLVRAPAGSGEGAEEEEGDGPGGEPPLDAAPRTGNNATGGFERDRARAGSPATSRAWTARRLARGLVGVSWRVLDAGPGIESWSISSQALGRNGARYVTGPAAAAEDRGTVQSTSGRLPPAPHGRRRTRPQLRRFSRQGRGTALARASALPPPVLSLTLLAATAGRRCDAQPAQRGAGSTTRSATCRKCRTSTEASVATRARNRAQGISAWVALALAAGGINPRCQARPCGVDAYGFLVDHFQHGLEEEITWPTIPTTALRAGTDGGQRRRHRPPRLRRPRPGRRDPRPRRATTVPSPTFLAAGGRSTTRSSPSSPWRRSTSPKRRQRSSAPPIG